MKFALLLLVGAVVASSCRSRNEPKPVPVAMSINNPKDTIFEGSGYGSSYEEDSVINDSMLYRKNYLQFIAYTIEDTIFIDGDKPMLLSSEGTYLKRKQYLIKTGKWHSWYSNGVKISETYYIYDSSRRINEWLADGTQILRNGNGFHIPWDPSDSVVVEVRDSVLHGMEKKFRKLTNDSTGITQYYLRAIGFYTRDKKEPFEITYWPNGNVRHIENHTYHGEHDKMNYSFHPNGMVKNSNCTDNGRPAGRWMYWDSSGVLVKEQNYLNGTLKGDYREYHFNGALSISGQYAHVTGFDTVRVIDPITLEEREHIEEVSNHPAKDGEWTYYNHSGVHLKSEYYEKGKLMRDSVIR